MERVSKINLSFNDKFVKDLNSEYSLTSLPVRFDNQVSLYFWSNKQSVGILRQLSTSIDLSDKEFCWVNKISLGWNHVKDTLKACLLGSKDFFKLFSYENLEVYLGHPLWYLGPMSMGSVEEVLIDKMMKSDYYSEWGWTT